MGSAHVGEPALGAVLSSLVMDATSFYNAPDLAFEFGYDADSRKAEKLFGQVAKVAKKLERFVGGEDEVWKLAKIMEGL